MTSEILNVQGLETQFNTPEGVVHAVNGVDFKLNEGETLGIVGESGCGKSVSMLSILRLIQQPPGNDRSRENAMFKGQDLLQMSNDDIRRVRGWSDFHDFLGPDDLVEPGDDHREATGRTPYASSWFLTGAGTKIAPLKLLEQVGIPRAADRLKGLSAPVLRWYASACHDRHGTQLRSPILIADEPIHSLGCDHPGSNRGFGDPLARRGWYGNYLDHARPWRGCQYCSPCQRDVWWFCDRRSPDR